VIQGPAVACIFFRTRVGRLHAQQRYMRHHRVKGRRVAKQRDAQGRQTARRPGLWRFSGPLALAETVGASFAWGMLVYDFIQIPLPVAQVRHRLLVAVSGLLQQVAEAAYDEGEELLSRVGPFGPVPGLSKAVKVHGGKVRDRGDGFVIPLRWSATGPTELFPVMEADLEIAPLGTHESQIRLSGSYDPPLGSVGRGLDRLLLHQLAEATVRAFLSQLVAALLMEPEPTGVEAAPETQTS
jgi:hypothetical protein